MKTAIFAHYDKDNIIDAYVIHYLQELNNCVDQIIFVSDCDLPEKELQKIPFCKTIAKKHGEYDFGSYKRGFELLDLSKIDQLILCNDSCYLIGDLKKALSHVTAGAWGLNINHERGTRHIQSYFLVLSKKIISDLDFQQFMLSITKQEDKDEIINKYELGLSKFLSDCGYRLNSLCESLSNSTMSEEYFTKLIPAGFPLLKTNLIKENPLYVYALEKRYKKLTNKKRIALIENHLERMIGKNKSHLHISKFLFLFSKRPKTFLGKFLKLFIRIKLQKNQIRIKILSFIPLKIKLKNK